jgi:hypothetical protein
VEKHSRKKEVNPHQKKVRKGEKLKPARLYRLGSWRADRIILVYKKYIEESGGEEGGQQQGGKGEGAERERRYKLKRLYIPIPSWAPNYVVLPTLFSKAEAAGLELVGAYRHGYMIPAPGQLGKD